MGSCMSTWEKVGIFAGAGALTLATGGAGAEALAAAAGEAAAEEGAGYSSAYLIGAGLLNGSSSCDKSRSGLIKASNTIMSQAILNSVFECSNDAFSTQNIEMNCSPSFPQFSDTTVYEANPSCAQCIETISSEFEQHYTLERETWNKKGKDIKVRLPIDRQYAMMASRMEACGMFNCKACNLINVTQNNAIGGSTKCLSNLTSNTIIKQNLSQLLKEQFSNNQDVMSAAMSYFGDTNSSSVTEKVSSIMSTFVENNVVSGLQSLIDNQQSIIVNDEKGTTTNTLTQTAMQQVVLNFVTQQDIENNISQKDMFKSIAEETQQHNSLNDIGDLVFESSFELASVLDTIVGKIFVSVAILLVGICLVVFGYLVYRTWKTAQDRHYHTEKSAQLIQNDF